MGKSTWKINAVNLEKGFKGLAFILSRRDHFLPDWFSMIRDPFLVINFSI